MRQEDIVGCVERISSDPKSRKRYGSALDVLHSAWQRLLGWEAKSAVVFEEVEGSRATLCGIGVSVFPQDDFVAELKARPFWLRPELARLLDRGLCPLLSDKQLREANSRGGLTAVVWEGFICPGFESNSEIYRKLATAFIEEHRGFFWKELISHQVDTLERMEWILHSGAFFWNPRAGRYTDRLEKAPAEFLKNPHVVGLTRELEAGRPGSWIGSLFEYRPPRFGFSLGEQRLLITALRSGTDKELSEELGISLATVKKTWRSIYDRVAACLPDLIPSDARVNGAEGSHERGKEKKQRLIAYVRDHPEEVRPISRKALELRKPG
jgi:DNA-binding CsgD family transcriptional regulator